MIKNGRAQNPSKIPSILSLSGLVYHIYVSMYISDSVPSNIPYSKYVTEKKYPKIPDHVFQYPIIPD